MISNEKLEVLREAVNSTESWDVAAALRGPDNSDEFLKAATTEVIRWVLFGKRSDYGYFGNISSDTEQKAALRKRLGSRKNHFLQHAGWAFEALGLKWDGVNPS